MMKYKAVIHLIALGISIPICAHAAGYEITVDNQAVVFSFINKTCNGGQINFPPKSLPIGQTVFAVQSDAQQGCMLRYDNGKGGILGIWIHQHQVDCSNEGTIYSYHCTFKNDLLSITQP